MQQLCLGDNNKKHAEKEKQKVKNVHQGRMDKKTHCMDKIHIPYSKELDT